METIHKSVCRICHGGCGVLVTVRDGRVIKVKGDPESPMNRGWMCIKGVRTPEIANHPDRLTVPLKRVKGRGEGAWQELSWEQALGEIAERVDALRRESGPESIALGQGTGRHHYMHVVRFANALGTPNWYEPGLAQCFIPRITVSNLTYGGFVVGDYYGATPPKCILFWGHNPLVSSPDGELGITAQRALEAGAVGISVDPRRSETGRKCQQWLPIRPGTDAALALAMLHVIIHEGLYDHDFVDQWTVGFAELKEHVKPFTPAWAAAITWVEPEAILTAARTYATLKPAILEWGLGLEQNVNALQTVRAVALLRAVTGNLDVPGGDILGMNVLKAYPTLKEKLPEGMVQKRLGAETYKLLGGWRAFMPSAHIPTLFNAMRTGEPYRVRGLLIFGNNPLATVAGAREVHASLQALDLLVVTDLFMTPTAELADYVLPAALWTETRQVIGYPLVVENIAMAQPQLTQTGSCRQDEWILDELAKRLDLPGCEEGLDETMNQQLAPLGITHDALVQQGGVVAPAHVYHKHLAKGFRTPSRKVELFCKSLQRQGYDPLPRYVEPPESPLSAPELAREFPCVLTTGHRRKEFFHSEHRQIPDLRRRWPDPRAELHPDLASRHGIAEGDWIVVTSPRGAARFRALVTPEINPGVVSVEHGWWFPEKPGPDHGIWESNANLLTNAGPPYDPGFGSYQLRGLLCRVERE